MLRRFDEAHCGDRPGGDEGRGPGKFHEIFDRANVRRVALEWPLAFLADTTHKLESQHFLILWFLVLFAEAAYGKNDKARTKPTTHYLHIPTKIRILPNEKGSTPQTPRQLDTPLNPKRYKMFERNEPIKGKVDQTLLIPWIIGIAWFVFWGMLEAAFLSGSYKELRSLNQVSSLVPNLG